MIQYLIILLDDTSVTFCHNANERKERRLIPLETLKAGILYGMKENLNIQFVYPDYALPDEYNEVIEAVDHTKIKPASMAEGADVVVIDLAGGECSRMENAYAYRAYDEAGPSLYAAAQTHDMETDVWSNSLYDFASGEWIEGFDGFCAHNTICYRVEDGYAVRRLGEAEPLAVYDGRCPYWRADAAVVSRDSGSVLVTEEGELPLLGGFGAYASNGEEAAFLLDDGRLLFYGPDGRSEVETDLGALSGQADSWVSVYSVQDGCVLLSVTDAAHPDGHSLIYDASGLVYDSAGSGYENMNYLTMGPDGPVYSASRRGVGGGWISDVVDSRGQVLLSGLADVSRGDGLPDGVIAARRGFERGYMDLDGSWLYSESIFASLADEDSAYYW